MKTSLYIPYTPYHKFIIVIQHHSGQHQKMGSNHEQLLILLFCFFRRSFIADSFIAGSPTV